MTDVPQNSVSQITYRNSAGNNFAFAARSVALASCVWLVPLFFVLRVVFRLLQRPRRPSGARKTCTWRRAAQYHWHVQWMSTRRRPLAHPFYGNAYTLSRLAFLVVLGQYTLAIWTGLFRRIVTNDVARGQFYVTKFCKVLCVSRKCKQCPFLL